MAAETPYKDGDLAAEAASGLPQLDYSTWVGQIFWLFITFGVLYFILARFILPKLGGTIVERADRVADDLDAASRMQREAEEAEKAYNQSLADARAKSHNVAESTRKAIDEEIAIETAAADAEAARQSETAEARIREMRKAALANINTIAADAADDIVKTLTGKAVTPAALKAAFKG